MFKSIVLILIKLYQKLLSPLLGQNCRFYPTCSQYTYTSIEKHGIIKGIIYGTKQISKCHPFYKQNKENL